MTLPVPGTYVLDRAETRIRFATRHVFGAPVRGTFALVAGDVVVADRPEGTEVHVSLDAASVDTGLKIRDRQLRTRRFLDAGRQPALTFSSTALSRGPEMWTLSGILSARGFVSPADVLISSIAPTSVGFTARATARLDTRDFGLPSVPGVLGHILDCTFEITARLATVRPSLT